MVRPTTLVLTWIMVLAWVSLAVLAPISADAQAGRLSLSACKKAIPRGAVYGSELITRECRNRFTTEDPYVAVVIQIEELREGRTEVAIQLLDPEQISVWAWRPTLAVDPGFIARYWLWGILAVATDTEGLAREHRQLVDAMIPIRGKPVRERLGEWTLRVSLDRSFPQTLRFTLQAAPGSAPPAPAQAPTPTPTP